MTSYQLALYAPQELQLISWPNSTIKPAIPDNHTSRYTGELNASNYIQKKSS